MPTYTVQSATKKKDVQGQHGPMQVISLVLQEYGQAETVSAEWFTKATTPLPAPGSTEEFELKSGQYGLQARRPQGQGGGGRGGRSPEESKSIVRQHSEHMALLYAGIRQAQGKLPDFTLDELSRIIDWFDNDAHDGWKK